MSKFYTFNNFNNNLSLDFGFNYNRYELKETLTNHNSINLSNSFNNKEIYLNINFNVYYSKSPGKHLSELNSKYLYSLNNTSINDYQKEIFNNLSQKKDFLILNQDLSKEKIQNIYDFFETNYANFEYEFDKNKKLHIDRNKLDYIKNCNKNNYFFEKDFLGENDLDELYSKTMKYKIL